MLTNEDIAVIMKLINDAQKELRKEFSNLSGTHSGIENATNVNVSDNTDAILELAEIVGGGE